ncbi:MAG: exosortase A [Pseudomonadota bacterium]
MPTSGWAQKDSFHVLGEGWRGSLMVLALTLVTLGLATMREWIEMAHQWWNIDTYNHILLVPVVAVWLVSLNREELAKVEPKAWAPGIALVALAMTLWLIGRVWGLNLLAHAGAVGVIQSAVLAVMGPRIGVLLALPLAYLAFLVPFGDEIIPFLQSVTAEMAIALTRWSGIPAVIDGIYIDTPVGLFIVAEECSGVKFLIAMVTLAVLVSFTRLKSWRRRAALLAASIFVPVLANGVRAWGTIYIAQFAGLEFAAGFDHIFYGWIFFAVVVAIVLAGAWPFFESEPEDHGYTASDLAGLSWLKSVEGPSVNAPLIFGAAAGLALLANLAAAHLVPLGTV